MGIELRTPEVAQLGDVVEALRAWQDDDLPLQLHPGDVGWFWRYGGPATAAAIRTWSRGGDLAAVGLLDGPGVLRLAVAPSCWRDEELAGRVVADLSTPSNGVLPAGAATIETPDGTALRDALDGAGWRIGEPWTPLRRDLTDPVEPVDLRVEVVGPELVADFTAVHRSAWGSERFTDEVWHTMAGGPPYADARCLLGYDASGAAVAGATVWGAGPGRPGLLEPVGVHAEHRGRGHGTAISVAGAAALREMGASSAEVCTLSSLTAAVAAYRSAGFSPLPERLDRTR